jgi:DNA-binding PadR family transcriptional regulator
MGRPPNRSRQTRLVLTALAQAPDKWWYGYDLGRSVGLKSGTLYPLLIRLNEQGLLEAEWRSAEGPGRPPRHMYRLTADGAALARELAGEEAAASLRPSPAR